MGYRDGRWWQDRSALGAGEATEHSYSGAGTNSNAASFRHGRAVSAGLGDRTACSLFDPSGGHWAESAVNWLCRGVDAPYLDNIVFYGCRDVGGRCEQDSRKRDSRSGLGSGRSGDFGSGSSWLLSEHPGRYRQPTWHYSRTQSRVRGKFPLQTLPQSPQCSAPAFSGQLAAA
eukprot:COSAG01_NODE_25021_length_758_cov_1.050076_1_plen_173_part_00